MKYKILAMIVIILFYIIYYGKKVNQKINGIKTNQLIKDKKNKNKIIEIMMTLATISILIIQLFSIIFNLNINKIVELRIIGFLIGILGDVIFLISIITMKDSWRAGISTKDETKLITNGIYKISRNPAFLGFDLMYIGILILYTNILTIIFTIFAITMLHIQILQEEKFLEKKFKNEYIQYKNRVPRYIGIKSI